jgi:hypothetical protein
VVSPDAIDTQIDELYRGPLDGFTASRNALVKTQRGADASRIRKLAKPTVVAWAVNQVYWQSRAVFDRLLKTGEQLRKTQIAALHGKSGDLRGASEAHRRAIADAVQEAERVAKQSGSQPSPDALMRTFEALSLASEPPEPYGRLTQPLQPAGFEALAGVSPALHVARSNRDGGKGAQPEQPSKQSSREAAAESKRRALEEQARAAAAKKHQAEMKKAEAAILRAKAAEEAAREKFEQAQQERRAAEQRLAFLKAHR